MTDRKRFITNDKGSKQERKARINPVATGLEPDISINPCLAWYLHEQMTETIPDLSADTRVVHRFPSPVC